MHQISVFGETKDILKEMDSEKINIEISDDSVTFYSENNFEFERVKEKLCRIIADVIQKKYGFALLENYYNSAEYSFSEEEKELISSDYNVFVKQSTGIIEEDVSHFLKNATSISLEGFVKFRLSGYKSYLKNTLDKYEQKLEAVREFDDLIELLKMYVETMPKKETTLNINILSGGGYVVLNDSGQDITEKCIKATIGSKKIYQMSFDELLLSCIITASPEKVVIHNENKIENMDMIALIKRIFGDRILICEGCKTCKL